jgi:hypothetical protein
MTCRSLVSTHHFTLRDWARRQQAAPGVGDASLVDGRPGRFCFVVDRVNNVTDLPLVFKIVTNFQENFPERLGMCFIVPSPFVYRATYSIVRAFLNEKTKAAVSLLARCSELQQYIDAAHIPTRMEGTDIFTFDGERDVPTLSEWRHLYAGLAAASAPSTTQIV